MTKQIKNQKSPHTVTSPAAIRAAFNKVLFPGASSPATDGGGNPEAENTFQPFALAAADPLGRWLLKHLATRLSNSQRTRS